MCVLLSLVDIVVIWVLSSQCLNVPQRGLSLWANPVNVPCLTAQSSGSPPNCLHHTLDPPDHCFCLFVTPLTRVFISFISVDWEPLVYASMIKFEFLERLRQP